MSARALASYLACLLVGAVPTGCIVPPIVLETERGDVDLDQYPPGSEAVAVAVPRGPTLRGVFVPSDPGAPVVVHFLESSGTVRDGAFAEGSRTDHLSVGDLRDLGFASLLVDYRGVGASDGERSPRDLPADAAAVFAWAMARAGGPQRVVLRSTSLGTLAAASVVETAAAPPAAWILIAPIRAETIAANHLLQTQGILAALLVDPFLRRPVPVDLVEVLGRARMPVLVFVPENDEYLPGEEARQVRDATLSGSGGYHVRGPTHVDTVLELRHLAPEEAGLLRRLVPDAPAVEARLAAIAAAGGCPAPTPEAARRIAEAVLLPAELARAVAGARMWTRDELHRLRPWLRGLEHAAARSPGARWAEVLRFPPEHADLEIRCLGDLAATRSAPRERFDSSRIPAMVAETLALLDLGPAQAETRVMRSVFGPPSCEEVLLRHARALRSRGVAPAGIADALERVLRRHAAAAPVAS